MLYILFISYLGPTLSTRFALQAQAATNSGANWWLWLVVLLVGGLIVAWLLGREGAYKPPLKVASTTAAAKTQATPAVRTASLPTIDQSEAAQSSTAAKAEFVASEVAAPPAAVVTPPVAMQQDAASAKPDNLTVIEGIGPKINSILHEAGINTFQDLANAEADAIKEILVQAGLRIHDPETWPEQAGYAMRGDWDGLKAFQAQLSGGRRL